MKIIYRGFYNGMSGFSKLNKIIIAGLKQSNIVDDVLIDALDGKRLNLNVINTKDYILIDSSLAHNYTEDAHKYEIKLGYSMLEADRIGRHWVINCNSMDGIIVPTLFNKETYKRSGVIVPIKSILPGVPQKIKEKDISKIFPKGILNKRVYKFLSIGQWSPWNHSRKNWEGLIEGYLKEFSEKDNVCLIIKAVVTGNVKDFIEFKISQIKRKLDIEKGAKIFIILNELSEENVENLFSICDCYSQPTHGEGYGFDFISAAMHNMPIITTKWSSLPYILPNKGANWIECKLLERIPQEIIYFSMGAFVRDCEWCKVDIEDISKSMRYCFENRKKVKEDAKILRDEVSKQTVKKCTNEIIDFINEIEEKRKTCYFNGSSWGNF